MSDKSDYDWKVSVSGYALRQVLEAISGPEHLLRELKVLASMGSLGGNDNPLAILFDQYNEEVRRLKNPQPAPPPEPEQIPVFDDLPPGPPPAPPVPEPGHEVTLDFYLVPEHPTDKTILDRSNWFFDETPLEFGENDLRKIVVSEYCNRSRGVPGAPEISLDGIFDEELIVTAFVVEMDCEGKKHQFIMPITNGKAVAAYKDLQNKINPAFNVTMKFRDRLFTFEGYMGFDRKSGVFTSTLANFTTDIGLYKLPAALGIEGIADSIKPIGIHVKGKYHTHVLKDPAKIS